MGSAEARYWLGIANAMVFITLRVWLSKKYEYLLEEKIPCVLALLIEAYIFAELRLKAASAPVRDLHSRGLLCCCCCCCC